jgi:hypothetical protein
VFPPRSQSPDTPPPVPPRHPPLPWAVQTNPACILRLRKVTRCDWNLRQLIPLENVFVGRGSSVGIASRYGLDGPGSNPGGGGRDLPHLSRPTLGPNQPASYTMRIVSFPGLKRPGSGVEHPPIARAEVNERVKLYFYSPSAPSSPVLG